MRRTLGIKGIAVLGFISVLGHSEERSDKQDDGLLFRLDGNGERTLSEIRLAGKREVIIIDG